MAKKKVTDSNDTAVLAAANEDHIIRTEYSELMQKSYIDYAMSVIVSRALPDVRDGLKPVQRRTLYDMYELGIRSDRPYRKSARIVGDTMGKYHPHGDSSIYDALVVMAQDFKKEMPLVDGHGNFGNIEGDGAAAMRYTEARLQRVTEEAFLSDLDKDVVDFVPNFDETEKEPSVLPVRIPNFLINGSEGIAVGMATSTPPHNAGEVLDAQIAFLDNPSITTQELMRYIKGPDFPTGGIVINADELLSIYETGTGKVRIRGRVETEKGKAGHINLVITQIPYTMIGSGIGKFLSDVAQLSENRTTSDIVDITNQSDKEGIRIVIELKKGTDVENFKNMLYKKTRLEDTFGVNMLAIHDGRPETMGLKGILSACTEFLFETTRRKYTNLLEKEQKKREIQEGLIRACNVIDLIIEILRGSRDRAMAKNCMVNGVTKGIKFKSGASKAMAAQLHFTEPQANAILDMRLYKLIGLEIDALIKEHDETVANIYRYEDILESKSSMTALIRGELSELRKKYARERRTQITNAQEAVFVKKDENENRDLVFVMDRFGYAKTMDLSAAQRNAQAIKDGYKWYCRCKGNGKICLFTDTGQMHSVRVSDLPTGKLRDKGIPVDNLSGYDSTKEEIVLAASLYELAKSRVLFVTRDGFVKQVDGNEFDVTRKTIAATKLSEGDALSWAGVVTDQYSLVLKTESGWFLRFPVKDVSVMKKTAVGVRGIKLSEGDYVSRAWLLHEGEMHEVQAGEKIIEIGRLRMNARGGKGTHRG